MSASNSAYYFGHATREAARALVDLAILPAARSLWSKGVGGGQLASEPVRRDELRLAHGMVNAAGMQPLPFATAAAEAHRLGLVIGVTVHTFNRWQWAEAEFVVETAGRHRFAIDALAVKYGDGAPAERKALMVLDGWQFVERATDF
jgi:CO/xanthine dehydrogenase Mo-binding subunit